MIPLFKFKVDGQSMTPTFRHGDVVLVNRLSYIFTKPKIGDLVVLKRKKYIIKRISQVSREEFFVLGDNKVESIDSREFGWIKKKEIVGKVIFKI